MSYLFGDGFDFWNNSGDMITNYWDIVGGQLSSVTPFNTGQSFGFNEGGFGCQKQFSTGIVEAFLSFYLLNPAPTDENGNFCMSLQLSAGVAAQCGLNFGPTGGITVFSGGQNGGSTLGNYTGLYPAAQWVHVQINVIIGTAGALAVRLNGTPVINLLTVNTQGGDPAKAYFDTIRFRSNNDGDYMVLIDDLFICSGDSVAPNSWTGEIRALQQMPAADIQTQFQPNSGSGNFSAVNAPISPDGMSYVQAGSVGANDLYALAPLAVTPTSIIGVNTRAFATKSDAGPRAGAVQLKSGANTVTSPSIGLSPTYQTLSRFDAVDPATGESWTAAGINALEIGPVVTG